VVPAAEMNAEVMLDWLDQFQRKRILVVEDEYLLADQMRRRLTKHGAIVIGPVASVGAALSLIDEGDVDAAVLDILLDAETSYPVAEVLEIRSIPFVFVSSVLRRDIPENYRGFLIEKPASLEAIAQALFPPTRH
jgi:CheY-like chemotaxis protein